MTAAEIWRRFCSAFAYEPKELERIADFCAQHGKADCRLIIKTADDLLNNVFLFQLPWDMEQTQEPVRFDGAVDWLYRFHNDDEFIFQLNRHRFFICLGQAYALTQKQAYADCFVRLLCDWIDRMPLQKTPNLAWRTLEAGLRADYWVRAMAFFAYNSAVTEAVRERFTGSLSVHAEFLYRNERTGFSVKSNWGVMEYSGLYVLACILGRDDYRETAAAFLKRTVHTQIMQDGLQWEASPLYHNEVLAAYLEAMRVSDLFRHSLFTEAEKDLIRKAAYATLFLKMPNHCQPIIGDSDATDVQDILSEAALIFNDGALKAGGYEKLDFESAWLFGSAGIARYEQITPVELSAGLHTFPYANIAVFRSSWQEDADALYFKNGAIGGGHGHQDKLHFGLWLNGEEVLRDSGRYTYTDSSERYALKGARAHNVPLLDGRDYAECADSWTYTALPPAMGMTVLRQREFLFMEGFHAGYIGRGALMRRRIIAVHTDVILICDEVLGAQAGALSQRFHFSESISLTLQGGMLCGAGAQCRFVMKSFAHGHAVAPLMGTSPVSRHYNSMTDAPAAEVQAQDAAAVTTVLVKCGADGLCGTAPDMSAPVVIESAPVYNGVYRNALPFSEAEGYAVSVSGRSYAFVLLHHDAGNHSELNGVCGRYGLGQTMAADLRKQTEHLTVLQW